MVNQQQQRFCNTIKPIHYTEPITDLKLPDFGNFITKTKVPAFQKGKVALNLFKTLWASLTVNVILLIGNWKSFMKNYGMKIMD